MDETLRRILGLPDEAELAAQREQFDAKLKELFVSGLHDNAGPPLLRTIVECDSWFVVVKEDSDKDFSLVDAPPGRYRLALSDEQTTNKRPKGRGGKLLPIYTQEPPRSTRVMDGRALIRALPADCDGLLLHLADKGPKEVGREFFDELASLAAAFDLETILTKPAEGQLAGLQNSQWWVEMQDGAPRLDGTDGLLIRACTHPDRAGSSSAPIEPMNGKQLFRYLSENAKPDGILVNGYSEIGRADIEIRNLVLSPGFAIRLLEGDDIRVGVRPLPARSLEEIEVWLTTRRFPRSGRRWVDAPYPEYTLLRVLAPEAAPWRMSETIGNQSPGDEPTWSPVFILPPGTPRRETYTDLGEGQTKILCAGLLAKELHADCSGSEDAARYGREGRGWLIGRRLDEGDQNRARHRLALARELWKLLPPDGEQIPRAALLTVEGAAIMRRHPHAATRAWIEATLQHAERRTKRWVWDRE